MQAEPESSSQTRTYNLLRSNLFNLADPNFTLTRKIHILGSFQNIKVARDAIVSLILGSPPGKVYAGLRTVSSRMRQRAL